jgi:hypothetical protein
VHSVAGAVMTECGAGMSRRARVALRARVGRAIGRGIAVVIDDETRRRPPDVDDASVIGVAVVVVDIPMRNARAVASREGGAVAAWSVAAVVEGNAAVGRARGLRNPSGQNAGQD